MILGITGVFFPLHYANESEIKTFLPTFCEFSRISVMAEDVVLAVLSGTSLGLKKITKTNTMKDNLWTVPPSSSPLSFEKKSRTQCSYFIDTKNYVL